MLFQTRRARNRSAVRMVSRPSRTVNEKKGLPWTNLHAIARTLWWPIKAREARIE